MTTTSPQIHELTPEEAERFDRLAEMIEAEKPDILHRAQLLMTAGDEPGFCGDVRRAIHSSGIQLEEIAQAAGIHVFALCDFLEGTADLSSTQLAAIVQLLGLQLVRPLTQAISPRRKQGP